MKNKKVYWIIGILIISLSLGGLFYVGTICRTNGENVCYESKTGTFKLEEQTSLRVAVESEETKLHLEALWSETYPETSIVVDVIEAMTRVELRETIDYDIYYVEGSEALYFMNQFANLGQRAQAVITKEIPIGLQDSYNINGLKFVPQNVDGKKLYLNTTLLESMGLTREDVSSFEKIKENQDTILQFADITFPFSFKHQSNFYPFFTGGGWTLNYTHEGMNPNIDSESFLAGMEFIQYLSSMKLDNLEEKLPGLDLPYNFEDKFFQRASLFGYINDDELAQQYKDVTDDEWIEIPFPTYKERHLAQEVNVRGYVVNVDTIYPSASAEVLRMLRTTDFIELGDTSRHPIYQLPEDSDKVLSEVQITLIEPFIYGDLPSILALDIEPTVRSIQIYQDIDFMTTSAQVYDGTLTPAEGQEVLLDLANQWLEQYIPEEEITE